jgi:hypothetical protein
MSHHGGGLGKNGKLKKLVAHLSLGKAMLRNVPSKSLEAVAQT